MRTLILLFVASLPTLGLVACGDDDGGGKRAPIGGKGGSGGTGGSSSTGGKKTGGAGSTSTTDSGAGGDAGTDAETNPGTGGVLDGSIVFPPIEAGPPADAGPAQPRTCEPVGTKTVSADPCQAYAEATCTHLQTCTDFALKASLGDYDSCVGLYKNVCAETYGGPGNSASLTTVHDCAVKLINAPCDCVTGEVCPELAAVPGTLANDKACSDGRQCKSGLCTGTKVSTGPFADGACGSCKAGGEVGAICGDGKLFCSAGLVCNSVNACAKPRQRAQQCSSSADCLEGLACADGKCGDLLGAGEDCKRDALSCNTFKGIFCVQGKCAAWKINDATGGGDDAKCGLLGEPDDGIQTLCNASANCIDGHCQERPDLDATCDPMSRLCVTELICSGSNRCKARAPLSCGP